MEVVEVLRNPDRPGEADDETDQTVSKEEEERYRKLQQENEQLQQLIAAREHKLKLLNQRLMERNASTNLNGGGNAIAITTTSTTTTSTSATVTTASSAPSTAPNTGPVQTIIHLPAVKKNRWSSYILLFFFQMYGRTLNPHSLDESVLTLWRTA